MKYVPPPTRHITFFTWAFDPGRVIVVSLQLTTFRARAFENAYCALTSSPSRGTPRKGGSTRSTRRLCGSEFTIIATSTSRGSFVFPGT